MVTDLAETANHHSKLKRKYNHFCKRSSFKNIRRTVLRSMVIPRKINPIAKLPLSPKMPSKEGMTPAPIKLENGIIIETMTLVSFFDPIPDRTVNPAGKKQVTITGCRKITNIKVTPDVRPKSAVKIPDPTTITNMDFLAPNRSTNRPDIKVVKITEIRDKPNMVFADTYAMPFSLTR